MIAQIELSAYNMLALYMTNLALKEVFFEDPIWSNMTTYLKNDSRGLQEKLEVIMKAKLVQIRGTDHCFRMSSRVKLARVDELWRFTSMILSIYHQNTNESTAHITIDTSSQPMSRETYFFTSDQELANKLNSGKIFLPSHTSILV